MQPFNTCSIHWIGIRQFNPSMCHTYYSTVSLIIEKTYPLILLSSITYNRKDLSSITYNRKDLSSYPPYHLYIPGTPMSAPGLPRSSSTFPGASQGSLLPLKVPQGPPGLLRSAPELPNAFQGFLRAPHGSSGLPNPLSSRLNTLQHQIRVREMLSPMKSKSERRCLYLHLSPRSNIDVGSATFPWP